MRFHLREILEGRWTGSADVFRNDTGEEVKGGTSKSGKTKEEVEKLILEFMGNKSDYLSTSPKDWESVTRKILARSFFLGQKITSYNVAVDNAVSNGRWNEGEPEKYYYFCIEIIQEALDIARGIESLSEEDRKDLLTVSDDLYADPDDPWDLDERSKREVIFDYFLNPTEEEIALFDLHQKKSNQMYNQLVSGDSVDDQDQ